MTVVWSRWLLPLIPVCLSLMAGKGVYHLFQLESYQFPGYFHAVKRNHLHA